MRLPIRLLAAWLVSGLAVASASAQDSPSDQLRVCADPNNLPFSNRAGEGFENRLAEMIAETLHLRLSYTWWAQRRGFIRNTLKSGECDVVMGVPAAYKLVARTQPYYRSTYVFVTRQSDHLGVSSITDARLHTLKIGVQLIGEDGNNPPPAQALGELGIVDNVRGYSVYGDYRQPNPPARLIEAVENGEIDIAAAWGPLGGYFAKHSEVPLTVTPMTDVARFAPEQFQFDIAIGVRKGDHSLRDRLDRFISDNRDAIDALLESYGIPLLAGQHAVAGGD